MEAIRRRAEAKANTPSSTSNSNGSPAELPRHDRGCEECNYEGGKLVERLREGSNPPVKDWVWKECSCRRDHISRIMSSSHITEEFQRKSFDNFDCDGRPGIVTNAYECAKGYAEDFPDIRNTPQNSLALLGRSGCGKTHLTIAASNQLLSRGVAVVYFPWVEGFNELKNDLSQLDQRIRRLQQAEVLFIDDMFKGRAEPTAFQLEQLFAIVNDRYLNKRPMIVSSEQTIAQMCEYDEAIASRINEMCRDYKVTLTGGLELNYRLLT
ncbi:ATP-binding protein [Paenibacillus hunanensis]|uniref:ATP-binding protein n=1 Tax=Paenibacillus hunanensis TaxID=539262 RepID=UPI00286A8A90|nr:ATP-binding protein [Paenibacillus hunanensis]